MLKKSVSYEVARNPGDFCLATTAAERRRCSFLIIYTKEKELCQNESDKVIIIMKLNEASGMMVGTMPVL